MELLTQQKIIKAWERTFADLSKMMAGLRVSEDEIFEQYRETLREDGLLAKILIESASNIIPGNTVVDLKAAQIEQQLARVRSGEYATALLDHPEPTAAELDQMLTLIKDTLPNVRQHLLSSAKHAPRYRRGGRPKELADPREREKIREQIKTLREPGVKLEDLFQRLAAKHGVSATTIKRIWARK